MIVCCKKSKVFNCRVLGSVIYKLKYTLTSISMSLKVLCDVKSPQTTFTTGNITLERMFSKQEEKLLFFGSVSSCTCLILWILHCIKNCKVAFTDHINFYNRKLLPNAILHRIGIDTIILRLLLKDLLYSNLPQASFLYGH